jgi:hypothetical protein
MKLSLLDMCGGLRSLNMNFFQYMVFELSSIADLLPSMRDLGSCVWQLLLSNHLPLIFWQLQDANLRKQVILI